ncbi:hypothetical protein BAE44_0009619 [Dichanthelium oligosanthes]|uniref:Uncharacterized protein n=1 Tax=Dichanthelium oligosanthes TaxID=888268 RepID=A0A1E5VWA6_9POAL|nr:hypothetical protein BAE44_0009619 [Dichanthelium oligosanthes]
MEAKQVKAWLSKAQAELEGANVEAKPRALSDEHDRCRLEAEECAAAWGDKERMFLDYVHVSEEEAVAEANVIKDSLKLARAENTCLNNAVADKDATLQGLRQEYESIKVSEAVAQGSLRELNSLLATTTTTCSTPTSAKTAPAPDYGFDQRLPNGSSSKFNLYCLFV